MPRDQIPDRKARVNILNKERLKDVSLDYEQEPGRAVTREAPTKASEKTKISLDKSKDDQQEQKEHAPARSKELPAWDKQQLEKKSARIEKDVENAQWMIDHKRMVNTNTKELERIATTASKDKDLMKVIENKNPELSKRLESIAHEVRERERALDRQARPATAGFIETFNKL